MHRTEGTNFTRDSEGRHIFTEGPPATTVTAAWLNTVQQEICNVIERSGLIVLLEATDTQGQLWEAINRATKTFSYIVTSQSTFNDLIERIAANQYKIKDGYNSVYVKTIIGGYLMTGETSPLSGGDTW